MNRFILIIFLMSGLPMFGVAESQVQIQGTGHEKNMEDFDHNVSIIERHLALSRSYINRYLAVLFMQELKVFISDVEKYVQLLNQPLSEDVKNQIKDLETNNFVLKDIKNETKKKPNFTPQKGLDQLYVFYSFLENSRPTREIQASGLSSVAILRKVLEHSNQCLNAENEKFSSNHLKQIKDICRSSKYTIEELLLLEKSRLSLSNSEKCNNEIKCSKYNKLIQQIEYKLDALTVLGEKSISKQVFGWRKSLYAK